MSKFQIKFSLWILIAIFLCLSGSELIAQTIDANVPMGWAVVPGCGLESTTGGANGETVVAKSADELISYTGSSQALVVMVEGTLHGEGRVNIKSNKTIMGIGANATIIGLELNISDESNIIIRNLTIKKKQRWYCCPQVAPRVD